MRYGNARRAQRPGVERPAAARRWSTGLTAGARRGGAPPQPAAPGCRLPAAGGRGQLRGPRRGSSAPSQRRGDAVEDMAARGGGRAAAPLLTIGDELGTNGGAPPVVEHRRLDLQRAPPERLAAHVESERLGGAVAGEGRSAHRCRGAVVVRRKPRGCLARAPTRTPPSPWAPRPSAASIAAAIATLGGARWRSGGVQSAGAAPSPSGSLPNCKELTFEGNPCYAEATGATARQA